MAQCQTALVIYHTITLVTAMSAPHPAEGNNPHSNNESDNGVHILLGEDLPSNHVVAAQQQDDVLKHVEAVSTSPSYPIGMDMEVSKCIRTMQWSILFLYAFTS